MISVYLFYYYFSVYSPEKISHVGTASRPWSLIHKDENTHLSSARVNCEERDKENDVKTWDASNNGRISKVRPQKSTHIKQGSSPVAKEHELNCA